MQNISDYNKIIESKISNNYKSKLENIIPVENEPIVLYYIERYEEKNVVEQYNIAYNLYNEKIGLYQKIKFPLISNEDIEKRIKILDYSLTEEDKKIKDNFKKLNFASPQIKDIFVFHKGIFYSQNKMSLYLPHILKNKKNIASIFLNENQKKLSIYDFQYMYSHNKEHIFKQLIEKRVSQFNENIFDKNIYGFYENIMYTIMDTEIIEKKLKYTDMNILKENLIPNKSEIYYYNSNKLSKTNEEFFVLSDNIRYLKGLSFEQTILYGILTRLNEYINLPNILFYECYMNINGERIIKSDEKILPGYQEIDYALYSIKDYAFEEKDFPLYFQSEYFFESHQFIKNEKERIFKIHKDRIYFFELKNSLNYYKINNNIIDKNSKDPNIFLNNLIEKCKKFANLYTKIFSISENTQIEIILFYDDNYSTIFDNCVETIKKLLQNVKIKFSLIYVLPSYPYISLLSSIEENREIKRKIKNLEDEIIKLKEENKKKNTINNDKNENKKEKEDKK